MAYEKDGKLYDERTHELIRDQHPGVPDSGYVGKHSLNSEDDDERERGLRSSAHKEVETKALEEPEEAAVAAEEEAKEAVLAEGPVEANRDSDQND